MLTRRQKSKTQSDNQESLRTTPSFEMVPHTNHGVWHTYARILDQQNETLCTNCFTRDYVRTLVRSSHYMAILHTPEGSRRATRRGTSFLLGFALLQVKEGMGVYIQLLCALRGHGDMLLGKITMYVDSVLHSARIFLRSLSYAVGFYRRHGFCHTIGYGFELPQVTQESQALERMWSKDPGLESPRLRSFIQKLKELGLIEDDYASNGLLMSRCFRRPPLFSTFEWETV